MEVNTIVEPKVPVYYDIKKDDFCPVTQSWVTQTQNKLSEQAIEIKLLRATLFDTDSHFPVLIYNLKTGIEEIIHSVEEIPQGISYKILATKVKVIKE